jgi:dUTP pyrophosphatase
MCSFESTFDVLKNKYANIMYLKIYIDDIDPELKNKYTDAITNHNMNILGNEFADAGFDLFSPKDPKTNSIHCYGSDYECGPTNKINFKIKCAAKMIYSNGLKTNTGFYMYPRSSLSKTPLRLANSVGIIDSGYRGNLIGMFDLIETKEWVCGGLNDVNSESGSGTLPDYDYLVLPYTRLLQICAPGLVPIYVEMVNSANDLGFTIRGEGGFGSTGKF